MFNFYDNVGKAGKRLENSVGRGEIAHKEQFLLFPVFSIDCRRIKAHWFVWEKGNNKACSFNWYLAEQA